MSPSIMLYDIKQVDINKLDNKNFFYEYLNFKKEVPDSILFFQIGEFFETFFQDARLLSQLTGINLGSRKVKGLGSVMQAGIPVKTINIYIKKLLSENQKVSLCTQFKDSYDNSCRKIIRNFTKGTICENEFLETDDDNFILAVCSDNDVFSISYADVSTGEFYETKGNLSDILTEIEKIEPSELLILKSEEEIFKNIISKYNTTILEDVLFRKKEAKNILLKYCKYTQKSFITKLDEIVNYTPSNYLSMDEVTRRNLELTRTKRFLKRKGSLLWFLNYTKTPMGNRLLKKYVNEPLLDIPLIKQRQSSVEEIIANKHLIPDLEDKLSQFGDISRTCAKISNSTILPKDLYSIAQNTEILKSLCSICKAFSSDLLKINEENLYKIFELSKEIEEAIEEEAPIELKTGGIIKEGYDGALDYMKSQIKKTLQEIEKYEEHEKIRLEINNLKIASSSVIGYFIEIPNSKANILPKEYLRKQILSKHSRFTTEKLNKLEEKINNLRIRTYELEYELFCSLRQKANLYIEIIRKLAQDIARIDVFLSYAKCAIENNLSKPNFNNSGIYIKNGFHPSLIKLNNEVIKNDTNLENSTMMILTGANMSGKSTFLKYNAIICLLSQIGSFVPADEASVSIIDKLFIRQGSTDDIVNNNSSFMVEMNDLKFILDNISPSSFVLLDEPAKSTNTKEGGSIARAFCEYLLNHHSAKSIVVTHNIDLTKLEQNYPNKAFNCVIGNSEISEVIISDRKIKRGVINSSLAINTAILAQLPEEIIEKAKNYIKN